MQKYTVNQFLVNNVLSWVQSGEIAIPEIQRPFVWKSSKVRGEMMHFDTKKLPLMAGENKMMPQEYLFVGIDDFSRELYAAIMPDKTQYSSAMFLAQVIEECPYMIEIAYSDNGKEYKGKEDHTFVEMCRTRYQTEVHPDQNSPNQR